MCNIVVHPSKIFINLSLIFHVCNPLIFLLPVIVKLIGLFYYPYYSRSLENFNLVAVENLNIYLHLGVMTASGLVGFTGRHLKAQLVMFGVAECGFGHLLGHRSPSLSGACPCLTARIRRLLSVSYQLNRVAGVNVGHLS